MEEEVATEEVELQAVEGAEGQVLAFVPVFIGGEGPFPFALVTGASQSLVDEALVDKLGLERTGEERPITGIIGADRAEQVRVADWRAGEIELPGTIISTLPSGRRSATRCTARGVSWARTSSASSASSRSTTSTVASS